MGGGRDWAGLGWAGLGSSRLGAWFSGCVMGPKSANFGGGDGRDWRFRWTRSMSGTYGRVRMHTTVLKERYSSSTIDIYFSMHTSSYSIYYSTLQVCILL